MKRSITLAAAVVVAAAGGLRAAFKADRPYVEGEVVVQYAETVDSLSAREANEKMGATVVKALERAHLALVQLPKGADTLRAVERYRKLPGVVTAEPNYIVTPLKKPGPEKGRPKKPEPKAPPKK